jgi:hypothetical protein
MPTLLGYARKPKLSSAVATFLFFLKCVHYTEADFKGLYEQFTTDFCACYLWKMVLTAGLGTMFDMWDWKGIQEKAGVNSMKAYISNDETSHRILNGCYTSTYQLYIYANTLLGEYSQ